MRPYGRFAEHTALCLVTTMAFVGAHELVHVAVGQALGLGTHFTSLTSADADPTRALAATPAALAWMAGAAPLFTGLTGIGALLAAPWARARRYNGVAAVLGWIAVFGVPYIGVQLMTLAGPAGLNGTGVDTAGVFCRLLRDWPDTTSNACPRRCCLHPCCWVIARRCSWR